MYVLTADDLGRFEELHDLVLVVKGQRVAVDVDPDALRYGSARDREDPVLGRERGFRYSAQHQHRDGEKSNERRVGQGISEHLAYGPHRGSSVD